MVINMFQCFKTDDHVKETFPTNRHFRDCSDLEFQVRPDVFVLGVFNCLLINVDSENMLSSSGEQITSVSFTGSQV